MQPRHSCNRPISVGIGGLGAIGFEVATQLDRQPGNLALAAVAVRALDIARIKLSTLSHSPAIVSLVELAACDIVVEALPAALFEQIAIPAIDRGRILVVSSAGALLRHLDLVDRAASTGARIVVASGALAGLDGVRAIAQSKVSQISIETRKPPAGLAGAPYLEQHGIDITAIDSARLVFSGSAREAAIGFPSNANVAAALAIAGIGPDSTTVEIWADPGINRNRHLISVTGAAARLTIMVESEPSITNPKTGRLAPLSVIACLKGLTETLAVGS